MILGMLMFGFGVLALYTLIFYMKTIIAIINLMVKGIWFLFVEIYSYFALTKPLQEAGILEKVELEKRLKDAEEKEVDQKLKLTQQNKIVQAGLIKVNQLRIKYPYANEDLFQLFITKFASYSVEEIKQMEDVIKKSHIENELQYATTLQEEKKYTLSDLDGIEPIEEKSEFPLIMKVYKIKSDYILYIKDQDSNSHTLLQSKDYMAIARMIVVIVDRMNELTKQNKNIQSMNINVLFENVVDSTQSFRRNKMSFLD